MLSWSVLLLIALSVVKFDNSKTHSLQFHHTFLFGRRLWHRNPQTVQNVTVVTTNTNASISSSFPVGLKNLRNTCYMNSVLQALFHVQPFRQMIFDVHFGGDTVGKELQNLFNEMKSAADSGSQPPSPMNLANLLGVDVRLQEDAEEFYLKLVNRLNKNVIVTADTSIKPTEVVDIATEQYIQCVDVNFTKSRTDSNLDLSVAINDDIGNVQNAIRTHFEPELLSAENQYRSKEHGLQDALKGLRMARTPKVLVVHLKRFALDLKTFNMKKINARVDVPIELDLAAATRMQATHHDASTEHPVTETDTAGTNSISDNTYDLTAVVVHEGSLNFGHYYCYAKADVAAANNNGGWVELNDERVSAVDADTVLRRAAGASGSVNAYMLFYVQRETCQS